MSDYFGPALPPGYAEADNDSTEETKSPAASSSTKEKDHKREKKHCRKSSSSASSGSSSDSSSDSDSSDGDNEEKVKKSRCRPTGSKGDGADTSKDTAPNRYIGPMLPPALGESKAATQEKESSELQANSSMIGPVMPAGFLPTSHEDSEEEDVIGPMPSEAGGADLSTAAMEIERRAKKMRDKLEHADDDTVQARETWMLELPPQLGANIGLGARKFKMRQDDTSGDRSGWTDTPADKKRKLLEGNEEGTKKRPAEDMFARQRDEQFSSQISQYNETKRPKTLLEIHEEKLHGKKKKVPTATLR